MAAQRVLWGFDAGTELDDRGDVRRIRAGCLHVREVRPFCDISWLEIPQRSSTPRLRYAILSVGPAPIHNCRRGGRTKRREFVTLIGGAPARADLARAPQSSAIEVSATAARTVREV